VVPLVAAAARKIGVGRTTRCCPAHPDFSASADASSSDPGKHEKYGPGRALFPQGTHLHRSARPGSAGVPVHVAEPLGGAICGHERNAASEMATVSASEMAKDTFKG